MKEQLPPWMQEWLGLIVPLAQILLIALCVWLIQTALRRLIRRLGEHYDLPEELSIATRRIVAFVLYTAALMLILERSGVSSTVLWTAFTSFAAVAAVAFFAAWSVLSNIFCALLIYTTRPFRLHDHIELLENGEKPGLKGEVTDINLVYTTLREQGGDSPTMLRVPNSLFFQRVIRRNDVRTATGRARRTPNATPNNGVHHGESRDIEGAAGHEKPRQ